MSVHLFGGVTRCQFIFSGKGVTRRGNPVSVHLFGGNPVSVHLFGVTRCQFIFSGKGVTRCQFIFSGKGVTRCQFIFSGKNDELTPDFRRMMN